MKLAVRINSVSGICLTKLDVLDGLDGLKFVLDIRALAIMRQLVLLKLTSSKGRTDLRGDARMETVNGRCNIIKRASKRSFELHKILEDQIEAPVRRLYRQVLTD